MVTVNADPYTSVLLVGFMASGKSTVGRELALLLGWVFVDMDSAIEERYGANVDLLFKEKGESYFRRCESEITLDLLPVRGTVLASGGGWAVSDKNWQIVPEDTLTVWLKVTPEVAFERAQKCGAVRPLLDNIDGVKEFSMLLEQRQKCYARAKYTVDSEMAKPAELAQNILSFMET